MYTAGTFNAANSPSGLASTDEVFSANLGYLTVLGRAQNEGALMLAATCTQTQLGTIGMTGVRVCRTEEIATAVTCQCCSPTPLENSTTCSDIASATSTAGGLVSYLSMMDGGIQLDSEPSSFPFSSGAHTSLVVKRTVGQVLLGSPSSLLGLIQYRRGTDYDRTAIKNVTTDMVDACQSLGFCPTLTELMGEIAQATSLGAVLGILKGLDCDGLIPGTADLVAGGMTEARALELRYLEGVNCKPYTVTLAAAGLLLATQASGSSYTCASGTLPCCLAAYNVPGMSAGEGLGCHLWVSGIFVARQVYSMDEAYSYLTPSPDNEVTFLASHHNMLRSIFYLLSIIS
jgi:hypothetical protein